MVSINKRLSRNTFSFFKYAFKIKIMKILRHTINFENLTFFKRNYFTLTISYKRRPRFCWENISLKFLCKIFCFSFKKDYSISSLSLWFILLSESSDKEKHKNLFIYFHFLYFWEMIILLYYRKVISDLLYILIHLFYSFSWKIYIPHLIRIK